MRAAAFVIGELIVAAMLGAAVFLVVIWQPLWIWVFAGLVMSAAFLGIMLRAKKNSRQVGFLIALSPLSYTLWILGLALVSGSGGALIAVIAYYVVGVLLLTAHYQLNLRLR